MPRLNTTTAPAPATPAGAPTASAPLAEPAPAARATGATAAPSRAAPPRRPVTELALFAYSLTRDYDALSRYAALRAREWGL